MLMRMRRYKSVGIITFYYRRESNVFENEAGEVVFNIFKYISPSKLQHFKDRSADGGVWYSQPRTDSKIVYEFIFPFFEEDEYNWEE